MRVASRLSKGLLCCALNEQGSAEGSIFMTMVIIFAMCFILLALATVLLLMHKSTRHHQDAANHAEAHGQIRP
jgi:hypothetical protein